MKGIDFFPHGRVPVIFDAVVCPPMQILADFSPLVSQGLMVEKQEPFFRFIPSILIDSGIQMIRPSLPALFADPISHQRSDVGPLERPMPPDEVGQPRVFLAGPGFFSKGDF